MQASCGTRLADFAAEAVERVGAGVAGEELHLLVQHPGELVVHGIGQRGMGDPAVVLHEPHLDVLEINEGNSPCIIMNRRHGKVLATSRMIAHRLLLDAGKA